MRFRVALVAVLVFLVLDTAQGFGFIDANGRNVVRVDLAARHVITSAPAADPPSSVPTTVAPGADVPPLSLPANAPPSTVPVTVATVAPPTTTTVPRLAPPDAVVARVTASTLPVYGRPTDSGPALVLPATTEFGNPRVLLATETKGDWVHVKLPVRPNGSDGWVPASAVTLSTVPDVIDVDVSARRLTWARRGVIMASVTVGVGSPASPTPTGTFFVTDVLPDDPSGPHGAWVLALNAHSDAFTEFEGGDARIAIHGTNDPSSIGRSVSAGCVRADADTLADLAHALSPGTPVVIH